MHRSGSTTRASEYYVVGMSAAAGTAATPPSAGGKGGASGGQVRRSSSVGVLADQSEGMMPLPKYDPQSGVAKKEAARARSAERAVHLIPLVLITCALVLWFFSSPKLDVMSKDDSLVARIENMTIDGYSNDANSSLADDVTSAEKMSIEEVHGRMLKEKSLSKVCC